MPSFELNLTTEERTEGRCKYCGGELFVQVPYISYSINIFRLDTGEFIDSSCDDEEEETNEADSYKCSECGEYTEEWELLSWRDSHESKHNYLWEFRTAGDLTASWTEMPTLRAQSIEEACEMCSGGILYEHRVSGPDGARIRKYNDELQRWEWTDPDSNTSSELSQIEKLQHDETARRIAELIRPVDAQREIPVEYL